VHLALFKTFAFRLPFPLCTCETAVHLLYIHVEDHSVVSKRKQFGNRKRNWGWPKSAYCILYYCRLIGLAIRKTKSNHFSANNHILQILR